MAWVSEAVALCVVEQVEGPQPGLQGIEKIRAHQGFGFEYSCLTELTRLGCTCTPRFLDALATSQPSDSPILPGGFFNWVIMEKLPGRNLNNFHKLDLHERNKARLAFVKSIREFYSLDIIIQTLAVKILCRIARMRRCMYNISLPLKQKPSRYSKYNIPTSYIIDLEDAQKLDQGRPNWKFVPEVDFLRFELSGRYLNCSTNGFDPMVPCDYKYREDHDDGWLEKLAAESGTELKFRPPGRYIWPNLGR
ncbi:hypothetical protein FQN57_002260 [Myotisia sp. PD_48]|nr:hypothetical protein FQN57_002260 [Myotisia sp. PD_48]